MRTPVAAAALGLLVANVGQAAEASTTAEFGSQLDPFGVALLGAGLAGIALSRLLRRRH